MVLLRHVIIRCTHFATVNDENRPIVNPKTGMGDREHVLLISLGYFRPSVSIEGGTLTAGGDLRLAQILSRGPYDRIQAHLLTAGMGDVDLIYGGCTVVTHSIDKCFLSKPHSLLTIQIIYLLRVVKALTYISRHRKSLSACTVYSASNLFPDAFVGWACKWVTKSSRWVAIAHHIPQPELHNERSMQTRIQQLAYLIPLRIMARFATTIIAYNSTATSLKSAFTYAGFAMFRYRRSFSPLGKTAATSSCPRT